jgi:hypothetical protein
MHIDWHALGTVFTVALLSTVGLVGVFTFGIVGLARPAGAGASTGRTAVTRAGAYACFAACAAAVAYGIYIIVSK